MNAFETDIHCP